MSYSRILVAVDNSEHSDLACRAAALLAQQMGASVAGLHVYAAKLHERRFQQMVPGLPPRYQNPERIEQQRAVHDVLIHKGLRLASDSYLEALRIRCTEAKVPFEAVSCEGRNYERILEESEKGYDLVVMGAQGLGATEESPIGSVCERVARRAAIDLLVIRRELQTGAKVAAAVDGSALAFGAAARAAHLAKHLGGTVEVVSSFDPEFHMTAFRRLKVVLSEDVAHSFRFGDQENLHAEVIDKGLAKIYGEHLAAAAVLVGAAGLEVRSHLLNGKPFPAILEHVEGSGVGLLAVGRLGVHASAGLDIGSTAENLLRTTSCNVLLCATPARAGRTEQRSAEALPWTQEARQIGGRMPEFIRARAMELVERHARDLGRLVVSSDVVIEAKRRFMPD